MRRVLQKKRMFFSPRSKILPSILAAGVAVSFASAAHKDASDKSEVTEAIKEETFLFEIYLDLT
jgi:hypothetical protein